MLFRSTLKLDPTGVPIPTYSNTTITEVAKVFTGWAFASDTTNVNNFRGAGANYTLPMVLFPTFHEDGAKTIFNGIQIPANQGGVADLKQTLDALVARLAGWPVRAAARSRLASTMCRAVLETLRE